MASEGWAALEAVSIPLLRHAYLGRQGRLAGKRVECFDLPPGSAARRAFARTVFGYTERELVQYWIEQALTGGSLPPREVGSADELLAAVAARPGAIGYLDYEVFLERPRSGVRVVPLEVDGRRLLPTQPGYPLRLPSAPGAPGR